MPVIGAESIGVGENTPTEAPQLSTVVQVPVNIFTGTLQGIIGFTNTQIWVLVDNRYDRHESVLYWKFRDFKEWCQIKSSFPASCSGVYYGDRKIDCLKALAWWVTYLTLQGKIIDLNKFKTYIFADAIEESRIDVDDTRNQEGNLGNQRVIT